MELHIKPSSKNHFPLGGILIKDPSVAAWLKEIQRMKFALEGVEIYPIPNTTANSIWGCLVLSFGKINKDLLGKNEACQMVSQNFLIPERSSIHPSLTPGEIERLFSSKHIFHPEFGMVELSEKLDTLKLIETPVLKSFYVIKPESAIFIPSEIKSFQVAPVSPEEVLKNMEENVFPKKEKMEDEPLSPFEKGKLAFYKMLFTKSKENKEDSNKENAATTPVTKKAGWLEKLESFFNKGAGKNSDWSDKMKKDFENLEKRNQKQIDKLMDLFKNDPMEALKYAIPLDDSGGVRGGEKMELDLSKRWNDFSLSDRTRYSNTGGSIDLGDHYYQLLQQYNETADFLVKQKEYQKAAFVYMKLLKNHYKAAEVLEEGKYYQEAATIYLKHTSFKARAAACYEKGNMISEAIDLYKELNENEKVGDLYSKIHKRKEANIYFEKVVDDYKLKNQYVKASLIYKDKMNNEMGGQSLLIEGWREDKDAFNCLNNYFSHIGDVKQLGKEIDAIYKNEVTPRNNEIFLKVLWHEYKKSNELSDSIKEMAYEIFAKQIPINPGIVSDLKLFNIDDKELIKDTVRFSTSWKKNKKK
jgi:hypothetical protein